MANTMQIATVPTPMHALVPVLRRTRDLLSERAGVDVGEKTVDEIAACSVELGEPVKTAGGVELGRESIPIEVSVKGRGRDADRG